MKPLTDPFAHHPELRSKITDPLKSFFRDFNALEIFNQNPELHWVIEKLHSDASRETSRKKALATHNEGDLWVFAYGSLMWDPAFIFAEIRRARVPDHARRFILKDIWGGRGTREAPGLMAALDRGDGCEGLIYRISNDSIEAETENLWRREMIAPGYVPRFVEAFADEHSVRALTFVADYEAETIHPDLHRNEQIEYLTSGTGLLGTSMEYLENIVSQFNVLGIIDEDCSALLQEARAHGSAIQTHSKGTIQ